MNTLNTPENAEGQPAPQLPSNVKVYGNGTKRVTSRTKADYRRAFSAVMDMKITSIAYQRKDGSWYTINMYSSATDILAALKTESWCRFIERIANSHMSGGVPDCSVPAILYFRKP